VREALLLSFQSQAAALKGFLDKDMEALSALKGAGLCKWGMQHPLSPNKEQKHKCLAVGAITEHLLNDFNFYFGTEWLAEVH